MKTVDKNTYSQEIAEILSKKTHWILRYGAYFILSFFICTILITMHIPYNQNTTSEVILTKKKNYNNQALFLCNEKDCSCFSGVINTNKAVKGKLRIGAFLHLSIQNCSHKTNVFKLVYLKEIVQQPKFYYIELCSKQTEIDNCNSKYLYGVANFNDSISIFNMIFSKYKIRISGE